MLDELETESQYLMKTAEAYRVTLGTDLSIKWSEELKNLLDELTWLSNHLTNMRMEWASERCRELGHFTYNGVCTNCGEDVSV